MRFWPAADVYREQREGGHPAFDWPGWEPWEIFARLKEIAAFLSDDPNAQNRCWRGD